MDHDESINIRKLVESRDHEMKWIISNV